MDSPTVENTVVIRMKEDFNKFLHAGSTASKRTEGKRLKFSDSMMDTSETFGTSMLYRSHVADSSISAKELKEKEKEDKKRQVELITAKSKITELESQLASIENSRKRSRVEYEHALETQEHKFKGDIDRVTDLRHQLRQLADKEQDTQAKLTETRRTFETKKAEAEARISNLQKDKLKLQSDFEQKEFLTQRKIDNLHEEVTSLQNQLAYEASRNVTISDELELVKRQLENHNSVLQELEECRQQKTEVDIKLKGMEIEMSKHDTDVVATKAMKSQLDRLHLIEKENRRLVEENRYNRETRDNVILLREQNEGLHKQLERAEERTARFMKLQVEHEELQKKLQRWEILDNDGVSRPRSPSAITKRVSDLQASNAALLEKQGALQASAHHLEERLRIAESSLEGTNVQLSKEKSKTSQQTDLIKRLQRKLLLVTKERDGFKGIIDSYENEVTISVSETTSARTRQLEETMEGYQKYISTMEADLARNSELLTAARAEIQSQQQSIMHLQSRGTEEVPHATSEADEKIIHGLRSQIASLEKSIEDSERERAILEERIERRHLQGDYDPSKTKVVHFTMNPVAMAQKRQSEELAVLREENQKLKKRLEVLKESGGQIEDVTMKVEARLQEPSSNKDVEDMKAQLLSAELKNQRLTEAFKKTSKEFREVCYQLLGYKIDMRSNNQYRLMNMYADSPEDFLLFQQSPDGSVHLLGTDYSSTLQEKIEHYLQGADSIPAFLSSITLELFSQQTTMS